MDGARRRLWSSDALRKLEPVSLRHFVISLKEATFECLAHGLRVAKYCTTLREAHDYVIAVMEQH
jgi:hypothetical protein